MKSLLKLTLISLFTLTFMTACGDQGPITKTEITQEEMDLALTTHQEKILKSINIVRATARDCNDGKGIVGPVPALTWNEELYASAYEHSNDLANSNTFDHIGSGTQFDITGTNQGGSSFFNDRIKAHGYAKYKIIGENIAGGQKNIDVAVEAWLNSPAHCSNIMEKDFKEIGVAIVVNPESKYGIYWTQNFGGK